MEPTILSYFTRGTLYEKDAERLKKSCEKWELPFDIEGIDCFGKWHEHVCFKPTYIFQKLKALKRPVLWIDADGEIVQKPRLFTHIDCDVAVRRFEYLPANHPGYLYGATIYFDYNPSTLTLVEAWADGCQAALAQPHVEVSDQVILQSLLATRNDRIEPLPIGYAAIYDGEADQMSPEDLFIIQYQASRLYKRFINKEVVLFDALADLSIDELRDLRPRFYPKN